MTVGVVPAPSSSSGTAVSTTGTPHSVAATVTANTTLLPANTSRKGATVFQDDNLTTGSTLYLALGAACTTTNYTVQIAPGGYYEVPFGYVGIITGVWSAATGNARIAELT